MIIRIRNSLRKRKLRTESLRKRLARLLAVLGFTESELSVLFVGDRAMRTLNRRYRGRDRTTDVLSFPFRDRTFPEVQPLLLGDVVVSVPAAVRQAGSSGHSLDREIERLLVHGVLHLVGYDHERSEEEAVRMKRRELHVLRVLGSARG